jgi:hypothetical protein
MGIEKDRGGKRDVGSGMMFFYEVVESCDVRVGRYYVFLPCRWFVSSSSLISRNSLSFLKVSYDWSWCFNRACASSLYVVIWVDTRKLISLRGLCSV